MRPIVLLHMPAKFLLQKFYTSVTPE